MSFTITLKNYIHRVKRQSNTYLTKQRSCLCPTERFMPPSDIYSCKPPEIYDKILLIAKDKDIFCLNNHDVN